MFSSTCPSISISGMKGRKDAASATTVTSSGAGHPRHRAIAATTTEPTRTENREPRTENSVASMPNDYAGECRGPPPGYQR